jgi:SAM-dependent methyltransferase
MNHFLHGVAQAACLAFDLAGPILEVGAYQVPGQEEIADLRKLFLGKSYIGVDMRAGPGVDCVADVEDLPQPSGSIGTVIAMSTFEHVPRFWRGFDEIHRVLRPDGVLLVSVPFHFHVHSYPSDYWRFTPEAMHILLEDYPTRIIGWHGPRNRPANVWAVAFRERHPAVRPEQLDRYRQLLAVHAREPLNWLKKWRYRLAKLICGGAPLAPYLAQNSWDVRLHRDPAPSLRGKTTRVSPSSQEVAWR